MLMYNLLEYSENYSILSGSWWNYYRDRINDYANGDNADIYRADNSIAATSKSFEYKTKRELARR